LNQLNFLFDYGQTNPLFDAIEQFSWKICLNINIKFGSVKKITCMKLKF